jgi:hypothetical protein
MVEKFDDKFTDFNTKRSKSVRFINEKNILEIPITSVADEADEAPPAEIEQVNPPTNPYPMDSSPQVQLDNDDQPKILLETELQE